MGEDMLIRLIAVYDYCIHYVYVYQIILSWDFP